MDAGGVKKISFWVAVRLAAGTTAPSNVAASWRTATTRCRIATRTPASALLCRACQKMRLQGDVSSALGKGTAVHVNVTGKIRKGTGRASSGTSNARPDANMHTEKNLYPKVYDFQNLYQAYQNAIKKKRWRVSAMRFGRHLEENLIELQNELIYETYQPGAYYSFYVEEPKRRFVMAAPFRDRVLHHAVCNVIGPIFEQGFFFHSYACLPGKGTLAGVEATEKMLREYGERKAYCLKCDVYHYFASIDHDVLKRLIRKRIGDRKLLRLLDVIIDSTEEDAGIPLGNLTSQLFANIYLTELDRFVKQDLRARHYVRYMDDFILLSEDKAELRRWQQDIEGFLDTRLNLRLNHKTAIFPVSRGIDFLGYRIWPHRRLLRKRMIKRMRRALKHFQHGKKVNWAHARGAVASWLGVVCNSDAKQIREAMECIAWRWFGIGKGRAE